jgi:hypothetical protein
MKPRVPLFHSNPGFRLVGPLSLLAASLALAGVAFPALGMQVLFPGSLLTVAIVLATAGIPLTAIGFEREIEDWQDERAMLARAGLQSGRISLRISLRRG